MCNWRRPVSSQLYVLEGMLFGEGETMEERGLWENKGQSRRESGPRRGSNTFPPSPSLAHGREGKKKRAFPANVRTRPQSELALHSPTCCCCDYHHLTCLQGLDMSLRQCFAVRCAARRSKLPWGWPVRSPAPPRSPPCHATDWPCMALRSHPSRNSPRLIPANGPIRHG